MGPASHPSTARTTSGSPAARVAGLTVCIVLASVGLIFAIPDGTNFDRSHLGLMGALTAAFMLSERLIFHIEARSEANSYTPSEIGLAIGVVFVFPIELVIARLVGACIGMIIWRRPPPLKLLFNLAHFALETLVAVAIFRAIASLHDSLAMTWVGLLVGINLALVVGGVLVAIAISQFEGRLAWRIRNELVSAPIFHLPPAVLATLIAVCATVNPWLGLFAFTPAPLVWFMIRSHGALMHRHRDLTSVHDFSRIVGDANDLREVAAAAAERLAMNSRAKRVTLRLWANDGTPVDAVIGRSLDPKCVPETPTDPAWISLLDSRRAWRMGDGEPSSPVGVVLAKAGIDHCLVGAVADEHGPVGVAILSDRQGASSTFDEDDLDRLNSMVQQLAIVVRKAQFHSQIQHEAAHDRLTELPNRSYFEAWVDARVESANESRAVLLIDLDRFKEINDVFGHHAGDTVLIEAANRIDATCGPLDLPSRFGGDEFAVLADASNVQQAERLAEKIAVALERPFELGVATVAIGASIGIAMAPAHGRNAADLLRRADIAMYDAKARHIRTTVYCDDLEETDATRLTLLADLRTALKNNDVTVDYQPQIDVATGRVIGAEALARWHHPEHGQVNPVVFVGLAEQAGLIEALTEQVLSLATAAAVEWQRRGWDLTVSVNISAQSLLNEGLEHVVAKALSTSGLAPERLTLEITESTMMGETTRTHRILQGLADLGVRLSVDDFGTGYSSLMNLRHFPISELKIDRTFVLDLMHDENDDIIVRSTIDLGQNLGLTVVAEGVENDEVHQRLLELGCDLAQGYGISRPLTPQKFLFWMNDRHDASASSSHPMTRLDQWVVPLQQVQA